MLREYNSQKKTIENIYTQAVGFGKDFWWLKLGSESCEFRNLKTFGDGTTRISERNTLCCENIIPKKDNRKYIYTARRIWEGFLVIEAGFRVVWI